MIGDVLDLNRIARNLHRRRFEDGALRLDKVKLGFSLGQDGSPDACHIQGEQADCGQPELNCLLLPGGL